MDSREDASRRAWAVWVLMAEAGILAVLTAAILCLLPRTEGGAVALTALVLALVAGPAVVAFAVTRIAAVAAPTRPDVGAACGVAAGVLGFGVFVFRVMFADPPGLAEAYLVPLGVTFALGGPAAVCGAALSRSSREVPAASGDDAGGDT